MTMFSPLVAATIIANLGIKHCIVIDIITCIISALIWLAFPLSKKGGTTSNTHAWHGYRLLIKNQHIRNLNFSIMLNNISFIIFNVGMPVFIARLIKGDALQFSNLHGYIGSAAAMAFVLAGFAGTFLLRPFPGNIAFLTMLTSSLSFTAVLFGYVASSPGTLITAAVILGVAQYCFRISGITLGQAITPSEHLDQVIIAGDTVVSLFFFVGIDGSSSNSYFI